MSIFERTKQPNLNGKCDRCGARKPMSQLVIGTWPGGFDRLRQSGYMCAACQKKPS